MSDYYERVKKLSGLHSRIYEAAKKHGLITPGQMLPENSAVLSFIREVCNEALKEDPQQQRKFALLQATAILYAGNRFIPQYASIAIEAERMLQAIEDREAAPVQEPKS